MEGPFVCCFKNACRLIFLTVPTRQDPRNSQPPVRCLLGLSWEQINRSVVLTIHFLTVPGCELVGSIPPPTPTPAPPMAAKYMTG